MNHPTRRQFIATAAAATTPWLLGAPAFGKPGKPASTVRLGHIGVGGRGTVLLKNFQSMSDCKTVAICDPYRERRENAAAKVREAHGHEPALYNDFRELLADPQVDAVVIATADHWHVPIALAAAKAGKHIYLEKPIGYTMTQNKALEQTLAGTDLVFQYGTQQRSMEILRRGIEQVINGTIGKIERMDIWAPAGEGGGSLEEIPVPEGLDYDLFIGPAPMKPCTKDRIRMPASWYCRDYAIGFIAGWGAHPLDMSIWGGLDHDMQGPYTIKGTGTTATPNALHNALTNWDVEFNYVNGIKARFMSDDIARPVVSTYRTASSGDGTTFFGEHGWISLSRGRAEASNREWLRGALPADAKRVPYHKNWYQCFIDTVLGRQEAASSIGEAVRSDAMSHLSLIAIEAGEQITWDPNAYRITSHEALNEKLDSPMRGDWMKKS